MPQALEQAWELASARGRVPLWEPTPELQAQQEKPERHFGELPEPAWRLLMQGALWALLLLEPEQVLGPALPQEQWGPWQLLPQALEQAWELASARGRVPLWEPTPELQAQQELPEPAWGLKLLL